MATRLQIGVVGSAGEDHNGGATKLVEEIGMLLAQRNHTLVFGPELRPPSLSTLSAKTAISHGGSTLAIALGRGKTQFEGMEYATSWVYVDGAGGATREVILSNSCDGIIVVGGGVGTLIEIAVAYTNLVPIAILNGTGGWADRLTDTYLDSRKKVELRHCATATHAVEYLESVAFRRSLRTLLNH